MKRHRAVSRSAANLHVVARSAASTLERLESRQLLTSTPWVLSPANPLSQNWENVSQIATDDDWSGVSSIEGFDGDSVTTATGNNPTTFTAATPTGVLDIDADAATTPTGTSAGGAFEFAIASPIGTGGATTGSNTVAIQPSNAADAPYLRFYVNSTGVTSVHVKYDLIDIDTGTSTNAQQFTLQYRTDPAGVWTNAPNGYTDDAADITNGLSGKTTTVNSDLPAAAAGSATLQLRIITANSPNNDQMIAIDNIVISGVAGTNPGVFALANSTLSTTEGIGTYNIVINRTGGSNGAATVDYALTPGSAVSPGDFTGPGGTLTGTVNFADGQTTANIAVSIVPDTAVEGTESFAVALSNATTATLGSPNSAAVSITDDDVAGTFNFNPTDYLVVENTPGNVMLTVTRTGGNSGPVSLTYVTTAGTATDGSDYTGTQTGTVSFNDQQDTATITIPIIGDGNPENDETFTVTLSNPTNTGVIGAAAVATVTIDDDDVVGDPGIISFNPATAIVNENAGTVTLTLTRTATSGSVTVDYATADGTGSHPATSPGDYTGVAAGVATFANGSDTAIIVITLANDAIAEAAESFTITLGNPSGGATLGEPSVATVTIRDDDVVIPTGFLINEAFIDPPGANPPKQFVEIKGAPNAVLTDLFLLQIEGDFEQNPGQLDMAISLGGATLGSNGLLLITAATSGWTPQDPATNVLTTTLLNSTGTGFEFASYSFVLVYRNPLGDAISAPATDFDSDNTIDANGLGTLDALPLDLVILDGFGTTDSSNANDARYIVALPALASGGSADAIVRFSDQTMSAASFYYGIIAGASGNQTLTFSATAGQRSTNFPTAGIVTPGAVNAGVLPSVVSTVFNAQAGQKVVVTFSENVGASIAAGDFTLVRTGGGAPSLSLVVSSISPDGKTVTLTFSNTGGSLPNLLQDGTYTFTTRGGEVASTATGSLLPADVVATFSFLNADFNVSGGVGFDDLIPLAQNYGLASGATFAQGDANYDGKVDFADLVILAQKYGNLAQLAAMLAPPAPMPALPPSKGTIRKVDVVGGVPTVAAVVPVKASLGTKTAIR
jgi:hypothetical protein